ncbi:SMI1/KNR4 family protein (plasmid) [Cupriavidus necator]|uniref:hypothetical protein n=1 Tax=Cupriavidus necator TaxID=106590 RepID=UPI003F737604
MPSSFSNWFVSTFGVPVPEEFAEFLAEHPKGLSGDGSALWAAEDIIEATEDRDLKSKGICFIGTRDDLYVFLLRANDGRVFVVDRHDYQYVDAWFRSISTCIGLMDFVL